MKGFYILLAIISFFYALVCSGDMVYILEANGLLIASNIKPLSKRSKSIDLYPRKNSKIMVEENIYIKKS